MPYFCVSFSCISMRFSGCFSPGSSESQLKEKVYAYLRWCTQYLTFESHGREKFQKHYNLLTGYCNSKKFSDVSNKNKQINNKNKKH